MPASRGHEILTRSQNVQSLQRRDAQVPGDDARLDLTDLFVFRSPDSPGKTVLIFDVNPFMTRG